MIPSLALLSELEAELRESSAAAGGWERASFLRHVRQNNARGQELIAQAHAGGAAGLELVRMRSRFSDALLIQVWAHAVAATRAGGKKFSGSLPCAMLAIGGYGRGELSPGSDIDLLFVFTKRSVAVSHLVRTTLYLLWDAGLKIGHSARTIAECLRIAREDYQSETALLCHRFLAGDEEVNREFGRRFDAYLNRASKRAHLRRRLSDRAERYSHWDPSVYVQEPNVKESAGGLRDFHFVLWLARTLFGASGLESIEAQGLAPGTDCRRALEAYDFLLRVRNQLHLQEGGKHDLLSFAAQETAAPALGYEATESATACETLMRDYFLRARIIHAFCRDFLVAAEERLRSKRWARRRPRVDPLGGGLLLCEHHTLTLEGEGAELLEHPCGLMRVFEVMYRYGGRLSPELKGFIRNRLDEVDDSFRSSPAVRDAFFQILDGKAGVAKTLHEMHDLGFLGRYLPEFDSLTCFVQYDHYHRYTADEHTLLTQAALDELAFTKDLKLHEIAHIHREMDRTHVLRLALLLHDIGKARGPRHVHKSAAALPDIIMRMGMPADEGRILEFLVSNHILLSHTAERRDIEDPDLIDRVAEQIETVEILQMLYLLSYADVCSVAPGIWNDWRGSLMFELYRRVLRVLETGDALKTVHRMESAVNQVALEARAAGRNIGEEEIRAHLERMPIRYRVGTPPQDILRHIELARRMEADRLPCVLDIIHRRRLGNTRMDILAQDRLGLFALISGALSSFDLSVLEAKVYTRADGLVVDTFLVVDGEGKAVTDDALWERFRRLIADLLGGRVEFDDVLRRNRQFLRVKMRTPFDMPTLVEYDLSASEDATVLEVITPDRHGLLVRIASILAGEGVSISRAKILTEGPRAVDSFYVTDAEGRKITDRARLREICETLTDVLTAERRTTGALVG